METKYMNDNEFVSYIQSLPFGMTELIEVGGKFRWKINPENGESYILRPEGSKNL